MGQYLTIGLMTSIAIGNRERDYVIKGKVSTRVNRSFHSSQSIVSLESIDRLTRLIRLIDSNHKKIPHSGRVRDLSI